MEATTGFPLHTQLKLRHTKDCLGDLSETIPTIKTGKLLGVDQPGYTMSALYAVIF